MKVSELIALLQTKPQDMNVFFLDDFHDNCAFLLAPKNVNTRQLSDYYIDGDSSAVPDSCGLFIGL